MDAIRERTNTKSRSLVLTDYMAAEDIGSQRTNIKTHPLVLR